MSDQGAGTIGIGVGTNTPAAPANNNSGGGGGDGVVEPQPCFWDANGQTRTINGITYRQYSRICPGTTLDPDGTPSRSITTHWYADTNPQDLATTLWDQTQATIPQPTYASAPPPTNTIVNYNTWIWTDPTTYTPTTTTATVNTFNGPLTATITATPHHLTFTPNEPDSQPITCTGPGTPWHPHTNPNTTSDCSYTYRHPSTSTPTGTYLATLTTTWTITYTTNTGQTGTLDTNFTTTTQQPITVNEVQALITN